MRSLGGKSRFIGIFTQVCNPIHTGVTMTTGNAERFKMTTKRNKSITLYLDEELLSKLTKAAEGWKLTRNEAILRILTSYLTPVR